MSENTQTTREASDDIIIHKILVKKFQGGAELQVYPNPDELEGNEDMFTNFTVHTSIFKAGLTGVLKFREFGSMGDKFNFVGNEYVEMDVETPPVDGKDVPNGRKKIRLCVEDAHQLGDPTDERRAGEIDSYDIGWELNLISCESYFLQYAEMDYQDQSFMGKIANTRKFNDEGTEVENDEDEEEEGPNRGLVNFLAPKYFDGDIPGSSVTKPMAIQGTENSIWLKENHLMYPYAKDCHSPSVLALMNNITEYAVEGEEGLGVNYCFYQDLDRWHFRTIRKMIRRGSKRDYWIAQKLKAKKLIEKYDKEINLIHTQLDKLKEE